MLLLKLAILLASAYAVAALVLGPRRAAALWKRFGQAAGDILASIVLVAFYLTILVPFAAIVALHRDPLGVKVRGASPWLAHAPPTADLDAARRQS